jgi:hypothetical protein
VRSDTPTHRKEREEWGTRRWYRGLTLKAHLFDIYSLPRSRSLKGETWVTHSTFGGLQFYF